MKTQNIIAIVLTMLSTAWMAAAADQPTNAPPATDETATNAAPADETATNAAAAKAPAVAANTEEKPYTPLAGEAPSTGGLELNFHDVPLNNVLAYLSKAAGLIVVSDVNLQGRVSVVASQPISTNDIVALLNDQLGKNGYAAVLDGRTLNVMTADRAKNYFGTPVKVAQGFEGIPLNDEIVTEILPLHTLNATSLRKDLDLLIPRDVDVTANESANSLLMTGPQKDIHRIAEIVSDMDGSALSEVIVTPLDYADAKSVASELKEIFQTEDSNVSRAATRNSVVTGGGGRGGRGGRGGGGFLQQMMGGGGGFGAGGGNASDGSDRNVQTHAVFVSDDQLNAVVSSAPPDYMHIITNVIAQLDQPSQDITVLKVFFLKHADPVEISGELASIFPSSSDPNSRGPGMTFAGARGGAGGRGGGAGGFGGGAGANAQSDRMKRENTVMAVPDARTQSVLVSASKDMMDQIEGVIQRLDEGDQGNMIFAVFDGGDADPATIQTTLGQLFQSPNSRTQSTTATATPLGNRYQGNANSMTTSTQNSASMGGSLGSSALR